MDSLIWGEESEKIEKIKFIFEHNYTEKFLNTKFKIVAIEPEPLMLRVNFTLKYLACAIKICFCKGIFKLSIKNF